MDQGDRIAGIYQKQKEMEAQRELVKMQMEFEKLSQDYEMQMLQDPNITPEQATAGWQQATSGFAQKYNSPDLSPMMRDIVGTRSQQLLNKGGFNVAKTATLAHIQNAKQDYLNGLQTALDTGNMELAQLSFQGMRGIMAGPEVDRIEQTFNRKYQTVTATNTVADLPFDYAAMFKSDPARAVKELGISWEEAPRFEAMADSQAKQRISTEFDRFYDMVAENKVTTGEDVDLQFGTTVPPRTVASMKDYLLKANDAKQIDFYKTEEGQRQGMARLQQLFKQMPKTGGDEYYAMMGEAKHITSMLQDSPFEEYARLRISDVAGERSAKKDDAVALVGKQIEAMELPGDLFGQPVPEPKRMKVSEEINAGFLSNPTLLKKLGLSEDQVDEFKDEKLTKAKREDLFRKYYDEALPRRSKDLTDAQKAIAEAIKKGDTDVNFINPDEAAAYRDYQMRKENAKSIMLEKALKAFKEDPTLKSEDLMNKALEALDDPENSAFANDILGE